MVFPKEFAKSKNSDCEQMESSVLNTVISSEEIILLKHCFKPFWKFYVCITLPHHHLSAYQHGRELGAQAGDFFDGKVGRGRWRLLPEAASRLGADGV